MGTFDAGFEFDLLLSKGFWSDYTETQKVTVHSSSNYFKTYSFKTDHVRRNIARMVYVGRHPILTSYHLEVIPSIINMVIRQFLHGRLWGGFGFCRHDKLSLPTYF